MFSEYFSNNATTSSSTSCLPSAVSKDIPDGANATAANNVGGAPQQKSVEIADTSYRPQDSPTGKGAPPQFPDQSSVDGGDSDEVDFATNGQSGDTHWAPNKLNGRQAAGPMGYDGEVTEEDDDNAIDDRPRSCLPAFLFIVFVLAISAVVFAYFLFESDRDLPIIKVLRRLPRVQSAKQLYYTPLRDYVTARTARFVKRLAVTVSMPPASAPPVRPAEL